MESAFQAIWSCKEVRKQDTSVVAQAEHTIETCSEPLHGAHLLGPYLNSTGFTDRVFLL